jgi:phospholipid/cholesterol/gamma-HCH transport system ATP-binding protein
MPMPEQPGIIELRDVHLSFDSNSVLEGVTFRIDEGESLAIIGQSGCGKSTLLKVAVGLLKPESGQVYLVGENIAGASQRALARARRKVGMLFQGNALFDFMNVRENVSIVLKEVLRLDRQEIDQKVKEMLQALHLGDIGELMPSELSGGMKKRVGLARALIGSPTILFCDAPTAGLDPITSDAIAELILQMKRRLNLTMLLVTNQMAVVRKLADRVAVLTGGKIIELGKPGELADSEKPEVKRFLEKDFTA